MKVEEYRQYQKNTYDAYKRLHLCIWCHQQDAYTLNGHAYCFECKEKHNAVTRKYNSSEVGKQKNKERKATLLAQRKENNECRCCGKSLPKDYSFVNCDICRAKARKYSEKWRREKGAQPVELRYSGCVCFLCLKKPPIDGKKLCKECYEKSAANARKQLEKGKKLGQEVSRKYVDNLFKLYKAQRVGGI